MKVKNKHLKGRISNFPKYIVQLMVDAQVRQGNKADPSVFALDESSCKSMGGFDWGEDVLYHDIWVRVICGREFHLIPKPEKPKGHIHAKLMKQYAKDAAISETPWEFWEYQPYGSTRWHELTDHLRWCPLGQYRRKGTTESKKPPTPHEIIQAMLSKGMEVWAHTSDISYEHARGKSGRILHNVIHYDAGLEFPIRTHVLGWRYAVPINPTTRTEITKLP